MGRPNNVILLRCGKESFFRMWMEFLTPFHHLTSREKDVAARILSQIERLSEGCGGDGSVVSELLWTQASRNDIRDSLGMSRPHFQIVLGSLRHKGFLNGSEVNPRFIPHLSEGGGPFMLNVIFDRDGAAAR